jgi:signal transduction histidine kinase
MINEINIKGSKILIVDDISENIKLLGTYLKSKYKIAVASNGEQALEAAIKFQPDLTLMDINMPILNGYEATEKLMNNSSIAPHPVIFTTALSDVSNVLKGFEVGGVDYVLKPFDLKILEKRIELHLKLKKYQELITRKNKELEVLLNTKNKFFSIVSHDLKSPFGGLLNLTEMMKNDYELFSKEEIKENISGLHKSIAHVYSFVENLLDWARTQTNKIQFNPSKLDLGLQIEELIELYKNNYDSKDIKVVLKIDSKGLAFSDRDIFHTIFRNIFSNAIKFSYKGSEIEILLSDFDNDKFLISVKDSGIGISEENLQKLFDLENHKLERGTDNEKGTGLGLLITKEMVEKQGGEVSIESNLREGSTVSFTVPKYKEKLI